MDEQKTDTNIIELPKPLQPEGIVLDKADDYRIGYLQQKELVINAQYQLALSELTRQTNEVNVYLVKKYGVTLQQLASGQVIFSIAKEEE